MSVWERKKKKMKLNNRKTLDLTLYDIFRSNRDDGVYILSYLKPFT